MNALDVAIAGAKCLARLVGPGGRFKYRYDASSGREATGYNVLRHAGSLWAMVDVNSDGSDRDISVACSRGLGFLLENYLRAYTRPVGLCICEDNKIKLGGNALSTLAILSLASDQSRPEFFRGVARQLCSFILLNRDEQGELIHKRYFGTGKVSAFRSEYYTGEALLALLSMYAVSGEQMWLDETLSVERALAGIDYGVAEQSHWMLYALELLQLHAETELAYEHAAKIARNILSNGLYLSWGRSTPIACRSEGLMAFVRMKHPENIEAVRLRDACLAQVESNLCKQLECRRSDGSFVRGGQDQRHNEVRIDYIQHNISAFLHFHRYTG